MRRGIWTVAAWSCFLAHVVLGAHATGTANLATTGKIAATLKSLLLNLEQADQADQANYKGFYSWCKEAFADRKSAQEHYNSQHEDLASQLAALKAAGTELKDEMAQLQQEEEAAKKAIKEAEAWQKAEHKDYMVQQKGLMNMITLVNTAVSDLARSPTEDTLNEVARSVLQVVEKSKLVSDGDHELLMSLRQSIAKGSSESAEATQEHVASLGKALQDLLAKLEDQSSKAVEQERQATAQYHGAVLIKKEALDHLTKVKDQKDAHVAETLQKQLQVQKTLRDVEELSGVSGQHLHDLKQVCGNKSSHWTARSHIRSSTSKRLMQVLDTLGKAVNGSRTEDPILVQTQAKHHSKKSHSSKHSKGHANAPLSFLQTDEEEDDDEESNSKTDDPDLAMASPEETQSSEAHPMVMDKSSSRPARKQAASSLMHVDASPAMNMLDSTKELSEREGKHKEWCDAEMKKNKIAVDEKSNRLQQIVTKLQIQQDAVSDMEEDIHRLTHENAKLEAEAESLEQHRLNEKEIAVKALHNDEIASQILNKSAVILRSFDSVESGQRASFLNARTSPQTAALLTLAIDGVSQVLDKYKELRKLVNQSETQSEVSYSSFLQLQGHLTQVINETSRHKTSLHAETMSQIASEEGDRSTLQTEVEFATTYMKQLQTTCADAIANYDDRRRGLKDDVKALTSAAEDALRREAATEQETAPETSNQSPDMQPPGDQPPAAGLAQAPVPSSDASQSEEESEATKPILEDLAGLQES